VAELDELVRIRKLVEYIVDQMLKEELMSDYDTKAIDEILK